MSPELGHRRQTLRPNSQCTQGSSKANRGRLDRVAREPPGRCQVESLEPARNLDESLALVHVCRQTLTLRCRW